MNDRCDHWNRIFSVTAQQQGSWFEEVPAASLAMLDAAGITRDTCVVDIGGGESHLIDHLIQRGLHCLAVVDVSSVALDYARARLGTSASVPIWIVSDVTSSWSLKPMDVWHDRAVFHFLTDADDRSRYVTQLRQTLKRGGTAIIATFALDGPERCSGLPVVRYSPESLGSTLGDDFTLVQWFPHTHHTPSGREQSFQYSRFIRGA